MISNTKDRLLLNALGYTFVGLLCVLCLVPLLLVVSGSLSSEEQLVRNGFRLLPQKLSLDGYRMVFKAPGDILRAFGVSLLVLVAGTSLGAFLTALTSYVISRKDFKYRNYFSFYIYFTSVFSGGLVPWYLLMVNYYHMKDNVLALIVPLLMNVFYILVMKSFFASIPEAIIESGKIDGAGELRIFLTLMLPIAKPGLATIALFIGLGYWNDWSNAMLFIRDPNLVPLQYYLYNLMNKTEMLNNLAGKTGMPIPDIPKETFKLAMTVIVIAPVFFVYPFLQRFIVSGVTVGSVKG
ncbi:carbohydrate ABC transporter permease [Cohnella thailandensis]|uniref:Carbohydrate ABC transporter permease n=1 Tax=Cohnella thailandensis TaxID=557557 RepID=A0A841SWL2_9BACL|nr:carbohydrate ABC transporter permease [Cohnella thailandensis]MBB6635016.1 carbohydrate ABC transporter permease [Cohnella thailandensis]MBP1975760.1 putative aldouronate transport system permease protein [Cohnella thailandensis]